MDRTQFKDPVTTLTLKCGLNEWVSGGYIYMIGKNSYMFVFFSLTSQLSPDRDGRRCLNDSSVLFNCESQSGFLRTSLFSFYEFVLQKESIGVRCFKMLGT